MVGKKIRTVIISGEGSGIDSIEIPGTFWNDSNVLCLDRFLSSNEYSFTKTHLILHLKIVHSVICKFYKKKSCK